MPTPANRAKIQLVRGTYANILASIGDLLDGELCYAKDQNKLYMVEGSTLTPLDYLASVDVTETVQDLIGAAISGGVGLTSTYNDTTGITVIDLDNTAVTTGTYGDADSVGTFTVDQQGRITSASNTNIAITHSAVTDWDASIRTTSGITQTKEPMGHAVRTDSTISFNNTTRTFTISPTSTSYDIWCKGIKFTKSSTLTLTIPNTTGLYYIYFDANGDLQYRTTYFDWDDDVPTAYVYWNATDGVAPYFADERHGITLDWATHEYLHRTRGAVFANGFSASNYTLVGDGSLDSHCHIDIAGGTFFDEDLEIIVTHSNTPTAGTWEQDLAGPAQIPVFYLYNTAWKKDSATNFPIKAGAARPQYNSYNAGTSSWSSVDADANKFIVQFIVATHNLNTPVISVMGQNQYDNIGAAESVNFNDLTLTNFPTVEFRPLYKVVYQVGAYTNTIKARLRSVIDIRGASAAGVSQALGSDHGILSGLGDDDHSQYLHVTDARAGVTANITTTGNIQCNTLTTTAGVTVGGDLTVNGTTTTIDTQNLIVEDKNVIIGNTATPTDVTADGGGITLKGDTDKTINWVSATNAWTFGGALNIQNTTTFGNSFAASFVPQATIGVPTQGLYEAASNTIALSTNSTERLRILSTGGIQLPGSTSGTVSIVPPVNAGTTTLTLPSTSGTILVSTSSGVVTSDNIADNTIVNADINSAAAIDGTKISPNFGSQNTTTTGTSTAASFIPSSSTAPTNGLFLPAANTVAISTGGTGKLFVNANGNIGVGASSPLEELHIAAADSTIRLEDTSISGLYHNIIAASNTGLRFDIDAGNVAASSFFRIDIDGGEKFRIDNSGRLLVGTSSTTADTMSIIQGRSAASAGDGVLYLSRGSAPGTNGYPLGSLYFSDSNYVPAARIQSVRDGDTYTPGSDQPAAIIFSTTPSGTATLTERMRINNAGTIFFGNGETAASPTATTVSATGGSGTNNAGAALTIQGGRGTGTGAGGALIFTTAAAGTTGSTLNAATERLRITSAGLVGMGTSAPDTLLHLRSSTNNMLYLQSTDSIADIIGADTTGSTRIRSQAGELSFWTGGAASSSSAASASVAITADTSGRLLVGTSTAASTQDGNLQVITAACVRRNIASAGGCALRLEKTRATSDGTYTIVSSGDTLGDVQYYGADGTQLIQAASIRGEVDGTPGANDMPGRIVLLTTADGAALPTERLRIANNGLATFNSQAHQGAALSTTAPAKLYLSTGTYTDTATAASGTVAHGTIAAFDNPAIAATNLTVTYTNASTVYIDGAPTNGTNVTITNGYSLYINGGTSYFGGNVNVNGLTASQAVFTDANKNLVSNAITGTGNVVMSTSPTLVTPVLGTPSSGTLTSCTGLPISTGVSGLGTGIATFLATPSSANLVSAITDETGSGALVFATSPTLTSPRIASGGFIADANGNEQIIFTTTASAINEITITNAAIGGAPSITATGTDTNVGLTINSKGTGAVALDSGTTGAINIGTNLNAKTITIGNQTGATAIKLDSGTGAIDIGTAIAKTITIGNTTGATGVTINVGTAGLSLPSGSTKVGTSTLTQGSATARTLTFPDATSTLACLGLAQTYTAAQRGSISALTDAATITPDFAVANNFSVTLAGNRTLANPTNVVAGQSGAIFVTQDGTGNRTLAFGANFDWVNGIAPSLTTTANAVDVILYTVRSATSIVAQLLTNVS